MSVEDGPYRGRTVLTLALDLASPMHVGSGFEDDGADGDGEIATVVSDACGKPYVPPTTIKGALRALARAAVADAPVDDMFGAPLTDGATAAARARPGWIVFSGASCVEEGKIGRRIDGGEGARAGRLIARRTAIQAASGVAASNKLFRSEMAPPGTRFEARLTVLRDPIDFADPAIRALVELLALWKNRGVAMGRGKGDGYGLLKLKRIDAARRVAIVAGKVETAAKADAGAWSRQIERAEDGLDAGAGRAGVFRLTLRSDLPFGVLGGKPTATKDAAGKPRANVLAALRDASGAPDLPGSSLMGVLRQRADWFARVQALRRGLTGEAAEADVAGKIQRLFGADAKTVQDERLRRSKATGFAGVLKLHRIFASPAPPQTLHCVKVDRFSMGPFDGGLFGVEAFAKPTFRVELYLDRRASAQDIAFATAFFAWLRSDSPASGLTLGHGGNRGFGWFTVVDEGAA